MSVINNPTEAAGIGGDIPGGTDGSILFIHPAETLAQDNANLFWDDTNNRLGVGTNTPSYKFTEVMTDSGSSTEFSVSNTGNVELITNVVDRDFSGAGNWTGTNWAISSGTFLHTTGSTADAVLANSFLTSGSIISGRQYTITFTISGMTAGSLTPKIGTATGYLFSPANNTTFTAVITANADNANLIFTPTSTFNGAIDNISVKRYVNTLSLSNSGLLTLAGRIAMTTPGENDGVAFSLLNSKSQGLMLISDSTVDFGSAISSGYSFSATGFKPASKATTPGQSAASVGGMQFIAGVGGDTTIATTGTGGIGGNISYQGGTGGVANSALTSGTGGTGGSFSISGGFGGSPAVSGGAVSRGGAGGSLTISAGVAGTPTLATILRGNNGGQITIQSGSGSSSSGSGNTFAGGTSGAITILTTNGGSSNAAAASGGSAGTLTISTGDGGSNSSSGNGGSGGNFVGFAGTGGSSSSGNGGTGGSFSYSAGFGGGSVSGNGGAGGNINYEAGDSGTGGTRPVGGSIYLKPGLSTVNGNIFLCVNNAGTIAGQVSIGKTTNSAVLELKAGTATASTAPLKFTSGTVLTTAEAGAVEFNTDDFFGTITTGAARKGFILDDGSRLTSGRVPFATTNGRLIDDADMTFATDTLTVTKIVTTSLQTDAIVNDTGLASGVYTPTRSAETNLDSNVTMTQAQYMRVGNTVTVSGRFTADPTLPATQTSFEITLPVSSNIGAAEDAAGTAFCGNIAGMGAEVFGVAANDTAIISWVSSDTTSQTWSYSFQYRVI